MNTLEEIIKNFLVINLRFIEPSIGEEMQITYKDFIEQCIQLNDIQFLRQIEKEQSYRNNDNRLDQSVDIVLRFIDLNGEPIQLNPERFPLAKAEFNQMFSPEFFLICYNYVKTGEIKISVKSGSQNHFESMNQTTRQTGCLFVILCLISATSIINLLTW